MIDPSNFPLGLFPHVDFQADSVQLQPGDLIVTTSDGVTEARDAIGGLFSDARLLSLLESCCGQSAEEVCRTILASVQEFVGAAPQSDDLTVSVVRYWPT